MSVRSWLLPLAAATVLVAGCGAGDGLRVEDGAHPVSPTPVPSSTPPSPSPSPSHSVGIMRDPTSPATSETTPPDDRKFASTSRSVRLDSSELRTLLLGSPAVDPDAKSVLATCAQCLARGLAADVIGTGTPQRIVTIKVLNTGWTFVAYLVGDVGDVPEVRSTIRGQNMRISAGKDKTLVVGSKVYGPTDQSCCPSGSKVELYKWNGNYLVKTSEVYTKG